MPHARALPSWILTPLPVHQATVTVEVAFRDCDPMGVLWHGNYLAYAEMARNALGRRVGVGIERLRALGLFAPVVRSQVWHHAAARPGDALVISAALHATDLPRLFHRYAMHVGDRLIAEAETDQVLTDQAFALVLHSPPELAALLKPNP